MSQVKSTYFEDVNDSIVVILKDNTRLEFKAEYSEYEDCVDLILYINGKEEKVILDVFVGYDDNSAVRAEKRRLNK